MNALRAAVVALMPSNVTWFEGEVPGSAGYPRVSVTVNVPAVSDRGLSRSAQARRVRVSFVVAGANDAAVHGIAERVLDAFEGKRPVAAGWVCGPFELLGDPNTYTDRDVKVAALDVYPRVTAFGMAATATRTA